MNGSAREEFDKAVAFTQGHALVIAIANYANVTSLPLAVLNDAHDIESVLTAPSHCGYLPGNVTTLVDAQATLNAISTALHELAARVKGEDTVIIFFSGHGARLQTPDGPTSSLVPVDARIDDLNSTTLLEAHLSSALSRIAAKRLVVFVDACHSGGAGVLKASSAHLGFDEKSLDKLAQGTGRVIVASSRSDETSIVFDGARNSLFTKHLLRALKGEARTRGDGLIRIFEIFNYVAEKVRSSSSRQHPIFKASNVEDNFPVALDSGGATKRLAAASDNRDEWRRLHDALSELYPWGPQDEHIWVRAGGDVSRLRQDGTGRAKWFAALDALQKGGGGKDIRRASLIRTALDDFPHHPDLIALLNS